jgi:hypothetical protein
MTLLRSVPGIMLGIVAAGVLAVASGCATAGPAPAGGAGPSGAVPSGTEPSGADPSGTAPASAPMSEQAAIYTAVLRQYLTTGDNSFGADHRFPVTYVLDRADRAAADPMGGTEPGTPIPVEDRTAIVAATADIGPVEFISDRATVMEEVDRCAKVRGDGILVVLGPPVEVDGHVEVAIHGFVACLGATWFTYIVERDGAGWRTNGTTGPFAIA